MQSQPYQDIGTAPANQLDEDQLVAFRLDSSVHSEDDWLRTRPIWQVHRHRLVPEPRPSQDLLLQAHTHRSTTLNPTNPAASPHSDHLLTRINQTRLRRHPYRPITIPQTVLDLLEVPPAPNRLHNPLVPNPHAKILHA